MADIRAPCLLGNDGSDYYSLFTSNCLDNGARAFGLLLPARVSREYSIFLIFRERGGNSVFLPVVRLLPGPGHAVARHPAVSRPLKGKSRPSMRRCLCDRSVSFSLFHHPGCEGYPDQIYPAGCFVPGYDNIRFFAG